MPDFDLTDSIHALQRYLVTDLERRRHLPHRGRAGEEAELCWLKLLEKHLPRRYAIRSGIVIDSRGGRSDEIDLIIYDPQYTPVFLEHDEHAYVFAEAVYAVIEVKTVIGKKEVDYAAGKAASVRDLHRTNGAIHHAGGKISNPRPLFPIVGGLVALSHSWSGDPEAMFREHGGHYADDPKRRMDLIYTLRGPNDRESGILWQLPAPEPEPESESGLGLREIESGPSSLVLFLYSLLHRLQRLATVPAVIWPEYIAAARIDESAGG